MAEKKVSEGQVIAETLEKLYRDGTVLKYNSPLFGLQKNIMGKYNRCRQRLKNGKYKEDDLDFARQLINTGIIYKDFDLQWTRKEMEYMEKLLEEG